MAKKKAASTRCPTCRTIVLQSDGEFPFCSERCRLIDLGKWASGAYRISVPITDPDSLEAAELDGNDSNSDPDSSRKI